MDVPNLIAIQTESFKQFVDQGLATAFADISPIESNNKDMCVEFGRHEFGEPKYSVDECKARDVSYQAPLFAQIRFINRETGEIKEQDVFMGDFPLMTPRGTFIINGTERVVVSQLVRSPGCISPPSAIKPPTRLFITLRSFLRVARGSSSRRTSAMCFPFVSTASASSQQRCCFVRSASRRRVKRSSSCSVIQRWSSVRSIVTLLLLKRSRSSSSIVVSVRASRPRSTLRARCSMACSSTRSAMALRRSVATRSTRSSVSTPKTINAYAYAGRHHRNDALYRCAPRW